MIRELTSTEAKKLMDYIDILESFMDDDVWGYLECKEKVRPVLEKLRGQT